LKLDKKFAVLRIIARIYFIVTILWVIAGILWFFGVIVASLFFSDALNLPLLPGIVVAIVGFFFWLFNAAITMSISEVIRLFLSLEENTYATRVASEEILALLEKVAENTHATAIILHHMNKPK
jgi:hypothetical protein